MKILKKEDVTLDFLHHSRKILLLVEADSINDFLETIEKIIEYNIPFQLISNELPSISSIPSDFYHKIKVNYYQTTFLSTELYHFFSKQKIGTKLMIAGKWQMVKEIKRLALERGFNEEDIQTIGYGTKKKNVYCIKCYLVNHTYEKAKKMICSHCNSELDVSKHYSKRLDAYLGYLVV